MTRNKRLTACINTCLFAICGIEVLAASWSLTGQRTVCGDYDVNTQSGSDDIGLKRT